MVFFISHVVLNVLYVLLFLRTSYVAEVGSHYITLGEFLPELIM